MISSVRTADPAMTASGFVLDSMSTSRHVHVAVFVHLPVWHDIMISSCAKHYKCSLVSYAISTQL